MTQSQRATELLPQRSSNLAGSYGSLSFWPHPAYPDESLGFFSSRFTVVVPQVGYPFMREATIRRPVTVAKLADAIVTKPYRILGVLIRRSVFPGPSDSIDEGLAMELAASAGVDLKIVDDEDGGASACREVPDVPTIPPGSSRALEQNHNAQQSAP